MDFSRSNMAFEDWMRLNHAGDSAGDGPQSWIKARCTSSHCFFGRTMQAAAGVSVDLVIVMQSLIIIFIAAPELVRAIFKLEKTDAEPTQLTKGWGA
jgi:hypothetical protein